MSQLFLDIDISRPSVSSSRDAAVNHQASHAFRTLRSRQGSTIGSGPIFSLIHWYLKFLFFVLDRSKAHMWQSSTKARPFEKESPRAVHGTDSEQRAAPDTRQQHESCGIAELKNDML